MKIHAQLQALDAAYLVVETYAPATGVFNIGDRVCLRLVRVPQGVVYKSARTKGVMQLEAIEVSSRRVDKGSAYHHCLQRLIEAMHVHAPLSEATPSKEVPPLTENSASANLLNIRKRPVFNYQQERS